MRFSFVLFGHPAPDCSPLVQQAERLGFDTVWFGDHVVNVVGYRSQYPYRPSAGYAPDTPLGDVWVLISHASAVTSRIALGTSVYLLPLRHPAVAAQSAATAQNLAAGRIVMGVGAGWLREEFEQLDVPFEKRGARLEEAVQVLQLLWSGDSVDFAGRWFHLSGAQLGTVPGKRIPVTFGGASEAALRRTAVYGDGWNGPECNLAENIDYRDRLNALRAEAGRLDEPFRFYVKPLEVPDREVLRRYEEAGFDDVVLPLGHLSAEGRPRTLVESLAAVERLGELVAPWT